MVWTLISWQTPFRVLESQVVGDGMVRTFNHAMIMPIEVGRVSGCIASLSAPLQNFVWVSLHISELKFRFPDENSHREALTDADFNGPKGQMARIQETC
jgi:hypothetical protein